MSETNAPTPPRAFGAMTPADAQRLADASESINFEVNAAALPWLLKAINARGIDLVGPIGAGNEPDPRGFWILSPRLI